MEFEVPQAVQSSFDGFSVVNDKGVIVFTNPACEQLYERPVSRLVGQDVEELSRSGLYYPCVAVEAMSVSRPITKLQRNAAGRTLLVTATPIANAKGRLTGSVLNQRDCSVLVSAKLDGAAALAHETEFVSHSPAMQRLMTMLGRIAPTDATVLLTGETGTGKTALCELIHRMSPRQQRPFVVVNCAAIPGTLVESQLFGYSEGSFTGAARGGKQGVLQSARGGTVVLDEVAELPVDLQAKLLQILDSGVALPVGGERPVRFNVRFLATTNRDLKRALASGELRHDLYYRLHAFNVHVPPLKDRIEDIPELAYQIVESINAKYVFSKFLTERAVARLVMYDWPGNVRELQNVLLRAAIFADSQAIDASSLVFSSGTGGYGEANSGFELRTHQTMVAPEINDDWSTQMEDTERRILLAAGARFSSIPEMAKGLGLTEPTLRRKIRRLFGSWKELKGVSSSKSRPLEETPFLDQK